MTEPVKVVTVMVTAWAVVLWQKRKALARMVQAPARKRAEVLTKAKAAAAEAKERESMRTAGIATDAGQLLTVEAAKMLRVGDVLHDGSCNRWRVNGQVQTWKRDSGRVRVPLKYGMYSYDSVDESQVDLLHVPGRDETFNKPCSFAAGKGK